MIKGINSEMRTQGMGLPPHNNPMTEEQKNTFAEILKKYDSENMTREDMKQLMDETKAAGIKPGEDMNNMLEEAGFKLPSPEDNPQGHAINAERSINSEQAMNVRHATNKGNMPDFLADFVNKFRNGEANEDDLNNLLDKLYSNGLSSSGNIFDNIS